MTTTTITLNPGDSVTVVTASGPQPPIPPIPPDPPTPPTPGGSYRGELYFDGRAVDVPGVDSGYVWFTLQIPNDAPIGAASRVFIYSFVAGGNQIRDCVLTTTPGGFSVPPPAFAEGNSCNIFLRVGVGGSGDVVVQPGSTWSVSIKRSVTGVLKDFRVQVSALN